MATAMRAFILTVAAFVPAMASRYELKFINNFQLPEFIAEATEGPMPVNISRGLQRSPEAHSH